MLEQTFPRSLAILFLSFLVAGSDAIAFVTKHKATFFKTNWVTPERGKAQDGSKAGRFGLIQGNFPKERRRQREHGLVPFAAILKDLRKEE